MAAMGLLPQKKVRLPEEKVRQTFLKFMVEERGFPASHILLERELSQLPHLLKVPDLPKRRVDLMAYTLKTFAPLLLVECKAVKLSTAVIEQVLGYNHFAKAPFISVVNQKQVITGWIEGDELRIVDRLPDYDELIIKSKSPALRSP